MRLTVRDPFPVLYALLVLILLMAAGLALGAGCLADGGVIRSSLNCLGMPTIPKFFEASTFRWGSTNLLAVNTGNELSLWNINAPDNPVAGAASHFSVGNQGDSDYDLLNHSICDDCRYGVATYKLGTVLFDMGTGTAPRFGTKQFHGTSRDPRGAFTFKVGSQQYLIANYLPDDCGTAGDATLYRYSGPSDIERLACIDVPGFSGKFLNGVAVDGYLYLGFYDNWIYIYRVDGDPIALAFVAKSPMRAYMGRGKGLAVDHHSALAVTSFVNDGMHVWDISNPATPVERDFVPGNLGLAAARYPFAWVAQTLSLGSERTFDLRGQATAMDPGFWDTSNPWNHHSPPDDECEWPTSAVFSPDGSQLYLTRYNVVQRIDFSDCPPPEPPMFADGFDAGNTSAWSAVVP